MYIFHNLSDSEVKFFSQTEIELKEKWADVEMKKRRHVKEFEFNPLQNRILKQKVQNVPNFKLWTWRKLNGTDFEKAAFSCVLKPEAKFSQRASFEMRFT